MADTKHIIEFGPKFCQAQFDFVLREDVAYKDTEGNTQKSSHWKRSFSPDVTEVIFDLTLTEWVATEQIAFLFAWIRNLKSTQKKVKVILPLRYDLTKRFNQAQIDKIAQKYKDKEGKPYTDSERKVNRRERSNAFLMIAYGMSDKLGLEDNDFENKASSYGVYNNDIDMIMKSSNQIVPFSIFELPLLNEDEKLDLHFYDIINNNYGSSYITSNVFELKQNEKRKLIQKQCYSPFETRIISNIITQELYTNSLQHSFEGDFNPELLEECYLAAFLSDEWKAKDAETKYFKESFLDEKYSDGINFYKNKTAILSQINKLLLSKENLEADWKKYREIYETKKYRFADLERYTNEFNNYANLEYTFLDFGVGIHDSLEIQYDSFIKEHPEFVTNKPLKETDSFRHSKIIEYAFLLDSSKNPIEKNIDNYELVPRGLYFLIDMVRRFKGMLIVRSGFGKAVFDFSDRIIIEHTINEKSKEHSAKAKLKHIYKINESLIPNENADNNYFPGTMYSIVLPPQQNDSTEEKDFDKKDKTNSTIPALRDEADILTDYAFYLKHSDFNIEHPKSSFYPEDFKYISILFIYNHIIESLSGDLHNFNVKSVYNELFKRLNVILDDLSGHNKILFIDFAGFKSGNPSYMKILYFLTITPKVNEKLKVVIVNLPNDERNIISEIKVNLFGKEKTDERFKGPFFYRPIPCLDFNIKAEREEDLVKWIGIRDEKDEKLFTALLLNQLPKGKDNILLSELVNELNAEGGLFVKHEDRLFATFPGYEKIKEQFILSQRPEIVDFLSKNIQTGIDNTGKEETVFLTSNGGFQFSYISLYEILNDKYVARYFAKSLLDKFCFEITKRIADGEKPESYQFDKIVTVTVSSQLIGIALRDLIDKEPSYSFFKKSSKQAASKVQSPELIMLSSYYSFDKEKPFSQIQEGENILILNDVISTGKLLDTIFQRINDDRKAIVTSVFSIVDTRIPDELLDNKPYKEIESYYFKEAEQNFFSLANYKDGILIKKFDGPYNGAAKPARINPLLNTIISMDSSHSEEDRVLFKTPDFINDTNIDSEYLKIGHYHQNLSHIGYLTDVRKLFASPKGGIILSSIQKFIAHSEFSISEAAQIDIIESQLAKIKSSHDNTKTLALFSSVESQLNDIKLVLSEREKKKHFRPDFIFYPIFSGIEVMGQTLLSEIFGTNPDNIIGLQRYSTPKGWRFPFPPKRYNKLSKNKTILILDSGSLSGESLVQLIDGISFLDVKEIYMLSVVTRIDDFNREFYSRLRTLKVKRLRDNKHEINTKQTESIVPLQILFGIKLNIPVYPKTSCPFCSEINSLSNIGFNTHHNTPNSDIQFYIQKRIDLLKVQDVSKSSISSCTYLPTIRSTDKKVDTKELFIVRDLIGKVDNYRFYSRNAEYFEKISDEINKNPEWFKIPAIQKELELILGCLAHESTLFELVDNLLNNISYYLKLYLKKLLCKEIQASNLFYDWENQTLIRLMFLILDKECFELKMFEKILDFDTDENKSLPQYILWDSLFSKSSTTEKKTNVERLILDIENAKKENLTIPKSYQFIKILSESYNLENITENQFLTVPFYNLHKFFVKAQYRGRHFALTEELNELITEASKTNVNLSIITQKLDYINKYLLDVNSNIIAITIDNHFREYCAKMDLILGEKEGGMQFYISRFKKFGNPNNLISIEKFNLIKGDLLSDSGTIVNKVLLEKADLKNFYSLCRNYICDYNSVLSELFATGDNRLILTDKVNTNTSSEGYITCHRDIFKMIIKEIIKNVKERYEDDFTLTASSCVIDKSTIEFKFEQNKPFIKSDKIGGLTNQVKYYCEKFNGSFDDNAIISSNEGINYIIVMKFKIHKYS